MSIENEIRDRRREGRLFLVEPLAPGASVERPLYVTLELWKGLIGPWGTPEEMRIWARLQADLDRFITGGVIDPEYLYCLAPDSDGVWEIRSVMPRPSIRIFGCFAVPDVFIATHAVDRARLGGWGSKAWRNEITRCKTIWRMIFPSYPPLRSSINECITSNVLPSAPFSKGTRRRPRLRISQTKTAK